MSCRPRTTDNGLRLLQVWDSGIGIPPASLPRIWDEFVQEQGNRPLQVHHRKGWGLGLAIVKRLAGMVDTPIGVRSRVAPGTVFSIELPVGKVPHSIGPSTATARVPIGPTLSGRFFDVEDEAALCEGLVVLLQAWGARVAAFDSVEAVRAWTAGDAGAVGAEPAAKLDLLLVDYRRPQGQTGIDALKALRTPWPRQHLPAIMITGSSLGGREDEALNLDYHLLIKPVLPNKLRAMIAFKLGLPAHEDRA